MIALLESSAPDVLLGVGSVMERENRIKVGQHPEELELGGENKKLRIRRCK